MKSGAVRGVILMEKEGGSGVEKDILGQGPESFVVGIVEEVVDSLDIGAIGSDVDDWVVQKKVSH